MNMLTVRRTSGSPQADLYDPGVAKVKRMSVEEVRRDLGKLAVDAKDGPLEADIVVTRHGAERLVVVHLDWYRRAREALGDPTDL